MQGWIDLQRARKERDEDFAVEGANRLDDGRHGTGAVSQNKFQLPLEAM